MLIHQIAKMGSWLIGPLKSSTFDSESNDEPEKDDGAHGGIKLSILINLIRAFLPVAKVK